MMIGVDWGGTKIEAVALSYGGTELARLRAATPRGDYRACLNTVADLVATIERCLGEKCSIGVGIPGSVCPVTSKIQNANSVWLNGQYLASDLVELLRREVRVANDANCLAVSEARDGSAAQSSVVFAAILGTGCGAGIAFKGHALEGPHRIAGEWGHNPLPWADEDELKATSCFCGKVGCIETFVSGTGFQDDFCRVAGMEKTALDIMDDVRNSEPLAVACYEKYVDRLARSLASIVNVLDPECIVLGGGMSNIDELYADLPARIKKWAFTANCITPIRKAMHGDSSGVRGAAWLWEP